MPKKPHKSSGTDDKKLQTSLKKMNVQPIQAIEEVNMFKDDGNVIHFAAPKGTLQCHPLAPQSEHPKPCNSKYAFAFQVPLTQFCFFKTAVHASVPSNTFAIYGVGEEKELTELVPGILNQLGPDSLASLRKLAESYQKMQGKEMGAGGGDEKKEAEDDDDDDIPDLVPGETFDSKVD